MSDSAARAKALRDQGIHLIQNGDRANGQELLVQSLELNSRDEHAWIWLASAVDNHEERRFCLRKVLELNPQHEAARLELASLGAAAVPAPAATAATAPVAVAAPVGYTPYEYHDEAMEQARLRYARSVRRGATWKALGAMTLLLGLALFMCFQMYQQAQVRGWVAGRQVQNHRITQKWEGLGKRFRSVYWISWTNDDIRTIGNHRTTVEYEQWARMRIGDPIKIAFISSSSHPYLVEGDIWASDGNILFNAIVGGVCLLLGLLMGWYATYVAQHGPLEE